jgi:hypothetical protein
MLEMKVRKAQSALFYVLALVMFMLNGCSTSQYGNQAIAQTDILDKIVANETSENEVRALLGQPDDIDYNGDVEIWQYGVMDVDTKGSYIPVVSMVTRRVTATTQTLRLWVTNGMVIKKEISEKVCKYKGMSGPDCA